MRLSDHSILAWLAELDIRTETGEPLDFRNHLFLYDIIRDFSPKQVNLKAAQVGGTLINILKAIWLCDRKRMDVIYTLPTDADVNVMGGGKVNRILANSPKLLELIKDKDTVQQKLIGRNMLYFRGTFNERAAIMVPADCLIHDEEDRSNQSVLAVYSSRLQHSKHKYEWHFSNPSFIGHGVHRYWQKSDKKHWFITCKRCSVEQYLSWPESVDRERRTFVCKHCGTVLSDEDRRVGRWQALSQGEYSGYWVSGLMAPWLSADYILDQFDTKPLDYFHNFVLGLPYQGDGDSITPDIIFRNCTQEQNDQKDVVIGVDIGKTIHYVCGNRQGLFFAGKTEDPDDIERLLKRFDGSVAVVDNGPDIFWPKKLRSKFNGRVFLCSFARVKKNDQIIRWGEHEEYGRVLADRNRLIQLVVDEFTDRRIPLQGTQDDWGDYYSHWHGMNRTKETDAIGNPVYEWSKADGNDHWCFIAGTKIETRRGPIPIEEVRLDDEVLTRKGWRRVLRNGLVDSKARVVESLFSDGSSFVSTPEHKVWVINKGFVPVNAMMYGDEVIILCQAKQSSIEESSSDATQNPRTAPKGSTTSRADIIGKKESVGFTRKSIRLLSVLYRKAFAYITRTKIPLITQSEILNVSAGLNTSATTMKSSSPIWNTAEKTPNISAPLSVQERPINGTRRKRGANTPKGRQDSSSRKTGKHFSAAKSAEAVSKPQIPDLTNTAGRSAAQRRTESGTRTTFVSTKNAGKAAVYNLTVDDCHEYFANGILVSNCLASAYWRIGMDRFGKGKGGIVGPTVLGQLKIQEPFKTQKFIKAVTKEPLWWNREVD